jgi:hypothetical protein
MLKYRLVKRLNLTGVKVAELPLASIIYLVPFNVKETERAYL